MICSARRLQGGRNDGAVHDLLRRMWLSALGVVIHHLREQFLIQAAPIHADAHGFVVLGGGLNHHRKLAVVLVALAHIAGVDAVL
jgi:hypothetical protein